MYKQIIEHEKYINKQIKLLSGEKDKKSATQNSEKLYVYHQDMLRNFQHERLVHLIITLFFAFITILFVAAFFWIASCAVFSGYIIITNLLLAIISILFITEIFYVRHYYRLENGTQKLYSLSKKLLDIINR